MTHRRGTSRHAALSAVLALVWLVAGAAVASAQGTCSTYRTFATGDQLTATDVNSIQTTLGQTNMEFSCLDSYQDDATQANNTEDPNSGGSKSLATTGVDEIEQIRYVLQHVTGFTNWWRHYQDVNFGHRGVRNHLTTLTSYKEAFRTEAHLSASTTRFHLVSISTTEYVAGAAHPESQLLLVHVNGTTRLGVGIGGDVHVGGTLTLHAAGTTAFPSIVWHGDSLTGFSRPAAHVIAISRAGTETARFDGASRLGIGVTNPTNTLHVSGSAAVRDSLHVGSQINTVSLATTGDTTLGDASTDTLTINGDATVGDQFAVGSIQAGIQAYVASAAATTIGLVVNTAASPSASAVTIRNNGTDYWDFETVAGDGFRIALEDVDNGSNIGRAILIGRNTNATTNAAGTLLMTRRDGASTYFFWPDVNGLLRINTTAPTNANDTAGTVVGDQTSWHALKDVLGPTRIDPTEALSTILATQVYDFRYRSGAYHGQEFHGLVGYDRSAFFLKNTGHPNAIPSLNEISLFGYIVQAAKALASRDDDIRAALATLERRVQALEAAR